MIEEEKVKLARVWRYQLQEHFIEGEKWWIEVRSATGELVFAITSEEEED